MDDNGTAWMNTREAAARLGLPARELYRLIDRGELRAYAAERDLRLRTDEVDGFGGGERPRRHGVR